MVDLKSPENIQTALTLVVPGLIILFMRGQFLTGRTGRHADAMLSYFTVSAIYLTVTLPVFGWAAQRNDIAARFAWALLVFAGPAVFGVGLGVNARKNYGRRLLRWIGLNPVHPVPAAWDWKFGDTAGSYVIVTLTDGKTICGYCGEASFASSDPAERDVYIEKVYDLAEDGTWQDPGPRSMLVKAAEIRFVEFIPPNTEPEGDSHGEEANAATVPTHESILRADQSGASAG
ncbi:hypothetical protein SAMN05444413_11235 [Roseivivax marinus]|uniref:DUF6338 family protein n=1 Tax=Roseivivax marinus TaxID=1379903 RepID=UPI0008C8B54E|nr:DUF6338 family protein [Roseivivax marinus]SEL62535.1 hypothetical protein SAMN05444413_11235 [Roseivivax marinus]